MKIKLFIGLSLFSILIQGQELPDSLTLNEAIAYGLTNNRSIINADRDIQKAKKDRWKTIASGLPQISSEVNYQNFLEMPVSLVPAEFFGGNPGEFSELTFGTEQNMIGSLKVEQLVFDGSYLVGLEASRVYLSISENLFEKTHLEIKKLITNLYSNALLAKYNIVFLEKNKASLEENFVEIHQLFKNGFEEEESVEQIQLSLAQTNSRLKYAKNLLHIQEDMLKFVIGYPIDSPLKLADELDDIFNEDLYFISLPNTDDIQNNIDIRIADNNVKAEALLLKLEKSKALPKVNAFINRTYTGNSNDFTFGDSDQKWYGSSLLGLNVKIPIFSSLGRNASTQKAKISLDQAKTQLEETQYKIRIEVDAALSDYQLSIDNYYTEKENLRLAESIERKNQTKFYEGMVQSFELRMAQVQLYTAQSNFVAAIQQVITNKLALETLLNQSNTK
ncbi:TolC family protein [Flavobacteriaceae bacterium]|jgi:outer membrane protein TolC|nr:TolC family protein [Flavobacteriaceae bacterium]MDA8763245.1 TolC family protein [Flavobacteriaceae bacterium]MDB2314366.1 TolC family protein [Flavobacteriaceae bacterium]MDC3238200.1 TolC family protein [Flavobacteriaceae bacterium]|tara:strand:- start:5794 stop:7137 length:1344 start_codon:yes stop_codon:yes gene_type:complete